MPGCGVGKAEVCSEPTKARAPWCKTQSTNKQTLHDMISPGQSTCSAPRVCQSIAPLHGCPGWLPRRQAASCRAACRPIRGLEQAVVPWPPEGRTYLLVRGTFESNPKLSKNLRWGSSDGMGGGKARAEVLTQARPAQQLAAGQRPPPCRAHARLRLLLFSPPSFLPTSLRPPSRWFEYAVFCNCSVRHMRSILWARVRFAPARLAATPHRHRAHVRTSRLLSLDT